MFIIYLTYNLLISDVLPLRKSMRIENIMKKKKDESSSIDVFENTFPGATTRYSHKRKLSKSKRDETHLSVQKNIKNEVSSDTSI